MVVLLTKDGVDSPNVSREFGYALGSKEYQGRLIPVIAATPRNPPDEEIPWVLRRFQMIHLEGDDRDCGRLKKLAETLLTPAPTPRC